MISRRKGFLILGLIFGGFLGSLAFLLSGNTEYKVQPVFAEIDSPFTIVDYKREIARLFQRCRAHCDIERAVRRELEP